MSVDTRVMLNAIFQHESDKLIKDRIKYARDREGHGKNFWKHFFRCDNEPKCAKHCIITYLFTEQQLGALQTWWKAATGGICKELKKNIEDSEKDFFEHPRYFSNEPIEPVYACCIKNYESERHPEVKRIVFGKSPAENLPKKCTDFFTEPFVVSSKNFSIDVRKKILKGLVINVRPTIEPCFKKLRKSILKIKNGVYFLYLGENYGTHAWMNYCEKLNPDCPLL